MIVRFGVYHWKDYIFDNGTTKNKYWIALNCQIKQENYYAVLPTSQIDKYKFSTINIDTVKIEKYESKYFAKTTILDFKNIQLNTKDEMDFILNNNKLDYKGLLESEIQEKIILCIKNSETLSELFIEELLCEGNSK